MFKLLYIVFIVLLAPYHGCLQAQNQNFNAGSWQRDKLNVEPSKVVASVNGDKITDREIHTYEMILSQETRGQPIDRQMILKDLINSSLLSHEAVNKKIDTRPEVVEALNTHRRNLLSTIMVQELTEQLEPEEALLVQFYDDIPSKEYRANVILAPDEDTAKEVISKLKQGMPFISLAKQYSIDPTGRNGGNLGWVNGFQVNRKFLQVLKSLKAKKYTTKPLKTAEGWQIVQLLDTKSLSKPAYVQVRDQLLQGFLQEELIKHIEALRASATITIN